MFARASAGSSARSFRFERRLAAAGALIAFVTLGGVAHAGDTPRFVTVTGDNDFFAGYDHHYTNGLQFAVSADELPLPAAVRALPALRDASDRQITLSLGQRIYTPSDKTRGDPDPRDRPYGGWLYAMVDVRARHGNAVDSLQASLGVIGPAALGRQTQNLYHRVIGADEARGWDKQLGNQPALLAGYQRSWPSVRRAQIGPLGTDITPRVGATIGNVYTYANAGAVLRLGYNLPNDHSATDISLGPPRDGYRPTSGSFGAYVWVGTDVRAVAWNTFLDGGLFGGGPSVKRKPYGHDLQAGAAVVWDQSRVGFTFVHRSKEFETQTAADKFGQITYSAVF